MHNVVWTTVEVDIALHGGLFGDIDVSAPASIHLSEKSLLDSSNHGHTWSHNHINEHSVNQKIAYVSVPAWLIIIIVSVEEVSEEAALLSEVSVSHRNDKSSVQEKGVEDVVGDVSHLFGLSFVTDSLDKSDSDFLKDHVDYDNCERH